MMRSSGLWILVALVAGGTIGFGVGSSRTPQPEPTPLEGYRPMAETSPGAGDWKPVAFESLPSAPRGAARREPTLAAATGEGVIQGWVLDQSGAPISDVRLIAVPTNLGASTRPRAGGGAPEEKSLEAKLAEAETRVRLTHAGRREAHSDGAGGYRLEGLADGTYRIQAYREGYKLKAGRGSSAWAAKPGASVDFVGEVIVVVYIDVRDPDGRPPERANFLTSTDEEGRQGRRSFGWSSEHDFIEIAPGTHWLTTTAGKDRDLKAPTQKFAAIAGGEAPRLTVQFIGRPGIRGQLVFPEPLASMRLRMSALRFTGDTPPDAAAVLQSREASRVRYDGRDRRYVVKDLEEGRYLLVASYDGKRPDLSQVVEVPNRMLVLDLEMPPVDRSYYRIVRVVDEKGEPVPNVSFSLQIRGPRVSAGGPASSLRRQDGSYYVSYTTGRGAGRLPAPGPEARITLEVSTRGRGAIERPLDPSERGDILVQMGAPATLDLAIDGFVESGLAGKAHVYLKTALDEAGMSFMGQGVPVTAEGRVHIPKLQAGKRIAVLAYRDGHNIIQVMVSRLQLAAGENRLTMRLPRLYDVRVEGAPGRVALKCLDPAGAWTHQFGSPPQGDSTVLRFVPPGRYEASASSRDGKTKKKQFDVPAQTVIRLD